MIRKATEQDIYEMMDIYNDAILHTTATFDTEMKDYENRKQYTYIPTIEGNILVVN